MGLLLGLRNLDEGTLATQARLHSLSCQHLLDSRHSGGDDSDRYSQ